MTYRKVDEDWARYTGQRLREAREQAGLSKGQLAALLSAAMDDDVSYTNIYHWEAAYRTPTAEVFSKIAGILGVPLEQLFPRPESIDELRARLEEEAVQIEEARRRGEHIDPKRAQRVFAARAVLLFVDLDDLKDGRAQEVPVLRGFRDGEPIFSTERVRPSVFTADFAFIAEEEFEGVRPGNVVYARSVGRLIPGKVMVLYLHEEGRVTLGRVLRVDGDTVRLRLSRIEGDWGVGSLTPVGVAVGYAARWEEDGGEENEEAH